MASYVIRRIGIGVVSLLALISVTFFLTRMMPGSPFQSGGVSEQVVEALEQEYGLSEPVLTQFRMYLFHLLRGDFGISYRKPGVAVADVIARAWPVTASIGVPAVLLSLIVGTVLGIWQAVTEQPVVRCGIFIGTILGMAIPNFVFALILVLVLGQKLKLLPIVGLATAAHYILPVVTLAVYPAAVVTRLMQNSFSEELEKEYVVMARAKGLSRNRAAVCHVLKNAWVPVLNYMGPTTAFLITGSFVVENIFTIPGLGREFVLSIGNRDYTMIMGLTIFMGVVVILINLLTDLLCAALSPQIRRNSGV